MERKISDDELNLELKLTAFRKKVVEETEKRRALIKQKYAEYKAGIILKVSQLK